MVFVVVVFLVCCLVGLFDLCFVSTSLCTCADVVCAELI